MVWDWREFGGLSLGGWWFDAQRFLVVLLCRLILVWVGGFGVMCGISLWVGCSCVLVWVCALVGFLACGFRWCLDYVVLVRSVFRFAVVVWFGGFLVVWVACSGFLVGLFCVGLV